VHVLFHTPWYLSKGKISHSLQRHRDGRGRQKLFKKIITGDEIWHFAYDLAAKRESSEWVGETSRRPKKLKFQRSRIKTMLIIFFNSQGVVHKEFVPQGKTVNAEFYKGVMDHLLKRIQRVHPGSSSCILLSRFFLVAQ